MNLKRISPPEWAREPDVSLDETSQPEHDALSQRRDELLEAVHAEVSSYLGDEELCAPGMFPDPTRMTGEYYLGDESYTRHSDDGVYFQVGLQTRFLEHAADGRAADDYVGLEVWLKVRLSPWSIELYRNTDSSSI